MKRSYTGVGSRSTPPDILSFMTQAAVLLRKWGYILRSGHAKGADQAFELGADENLQVFLPFDGFNGGKIDCSEKPDRPRFHTVAPGKLWDTAEIIASSVHPNWQAVLSMSSDFARRAHIRNVFQVLGPSLSEPSEFLVCWATPNGDSVSGGTRTAYEVAKYFNVPTYNVAVALDRVAFRELLSKIKEEIEHGRRRGRD